MFVCVLTADVMAASLGNAFTSSQWRELEIQVMIYKYLLASLPVPSYLLSSMSMCMTLFPSVDYGLLRRKHDSFTFNAFLTSFLVKSLYLYHFSCYLLSFNQCVNFFSFLKFAFLQLMVVSIRGYHQVGTLVLIQRQVGAEEQTVKNGDVLDMLLLITSIASDICIEVVTVQESLWNFTPMILPIIKSRGPLFQLQQNFLLPVLFILISNHHFPWITAALVSNYLHVMSLQIRNPGKMFIYLCFLLL